MLAVRTLERGTGAVSKTSCCVHSNTDDQNSLRARKRLRKLKACIELSVVGSLADDGAGWCQSVV